MSFASHTRGRVRKTVTDIYKNIDDFSSYGIEQLQLYKLKLNKAEGELKSFDESIYFFK